MPKSLKKFLAVFLLFFLSFSLLSSALPSLIFAADVPVTDTFCKFADAITGGVQGTWYEPGPCAFHNKVFNPNNPSEIFGERYTYAQVNWIAWSLFWLGVNTILHIFNVVLQVVHVTLTDASQTSPPLAQNFLPASVSSSLMSNSSSVSLPVALSHIYAVQPISGIKSVLQTLDKFSLASVVHAQGYGYSSLNGIQSIWAASRNLAYLLMVILLIAAGFMIMFRVKISAQAAVSLQVMIPKIIITLLAITFSYALAGFIIDLVYLLLGIIIFTLHYANVPDGHSLIPNPAGSLYFFSSPHIFLIFLAIFVYTLEIVFTAVGGNVMSTVLFGFIVFIIFAFLTFRIFFMLVKAYLLLIFQIIIGPWIILMGLLPNSSPNGSSVGLIPWLKSVAASASTFLVVPVMLIFVLTFWTPQAADIAVTPLIIQIINAAGAIVANTGLLANLMGGINGISNISSLPALPLFAMSGGLLQLFLGYALLSLIPKMAQIVQDAFKQPAFKYGTAFGEALGPAAIVTRPAGVVAGNAARQVGGDIGRAIGSRLHIDQGTPASSQIQPVER